MEASGHILAQDQCQARTDDIHQDSSRLTIHEEDLDRDRDRVQDNAWFPDRRKCSPKDRRTLMVKAHKDTDCRSPTAVVAWTSGLLRRSRTGGNASVPLDKTAVAPLHTTDSSSSSSRRRHSSDHLQIRVCGRETTRRTLPRPVGRPSTVVL